MASESQLNAMYKYDKVNTTQIHFKLNTKTDKDITEHLSKQSYIKELIQKDMKS